MNFHLNGIHCLRRPEGEMMKEGAWHHMCYIAPLRLCTWCYINWSIIIITYILVLRLTYSN